MAEPFLRPEGMKGWVHRRRGPACARAMEDANDADDAFSAALPTADLLLGLGGGLDSSSGGAPAPAPAAPAAAAKDSQTPTESTQSQSQCATLLSSQSQLDTQQLASLLPPSELPRRTRGTRQLRRPQPPPAVSAAPIPRTDTLTSEQVAALSSGRLLTSTPCPPPLNCGEGKAAAAAGAGEEEVLVAIRLPAHLRARLPKNGGPLPPSLLPLLTPFADRVCDDADAAAAALRPDAERRGRGNTWASVCKAAVVDYSSRRKIRRIGDASLQMSPPPQPAAAAVTATASVVASSSLDAASAYLQMCDAMSEGSQVFAPDEVGRHVRLIVDQVSFVACAATTEALPDRVFALMRLAQRAVLKFDCAGDALARIAVQLCDALCEERDDGGGSSGDECRTELLEQVLAEDVLPPDVLVVLLEKAAGALARVLGLLGCRGDPLHATSARCYTLTYVLEMLYGTLSAGKVDRDAVQLWLPTFAASLDGCAAPALTPGAPQAHAHTRVRVQPRDSHASWLCCRHSDADGADADPETDLLEQLASEALNLIPLPVCHMLLTLRERVRNYGSTADTPLL
eukprot:Rhum_TRINITY_DN7583_c0_g1::Rhum_TRINITY_DN7583_c0_g1_i1::g.23563::m.23563